MIKNILLLLFILSYTSLKSQIIKKGIHETTYHKIWHEYKDNKYFRLVKVNLKNGDTVKLQKIGENYFFKKISSEGLILEEGYKEGGMGHECGCNLEKHGRWMNFYSEKKLKEIGFYRCGKKIGKWLYYAPNGNLVKSESYNLAYPSFLRNFHKTYLNGFYKEFYQNGKIKISGYYEIVEKYDTYESIAFSDSLSITQKCCSWKPVSVKTGKWIYYNEKGTIQKTKVFKRQGKVRDIEYNINNTNKLWKKY